MHTVDELNALSQGHLPGLLGIEITEVSDKRLVAQLTIRRDLLAPNGYLHAGTVVTLADTACGYGVFANLPAGAQGFTTIELKSNFLGTALEGMLRCEAAMVHGGRTTQVWDARVTDAANDKAIALFRCTQLLIYPHA